MFKPTLRTLMVLLLVVAMLAGVSGVARAYLTPSNPDFVFGDPDAAHMPASYEGDYSTTLNPSYIIGPGSVPDYLTNPNWAYSPPLTKFVDPLPGVCVPTAATSWTNCDATVGTMNKNIPVAIPDIVTYPGSDYYELELVEFLEPMHSELPPTRLRGYRQVGVATDTSACIDPISTPGAGEQLCTAANNVAFQTTAKAHYLGPVIVAAKDRPVRVKFINKLPTGPDGNLFVPVDVTIMGAGEFDIAYDPITKQPIPGSGPGMFTQNRAELHLHGGRTPWISDGTPHQWITPAGENTTYRKGVSVEDVPDMPPANAGEQTYYWTNQQSSRLMFYHDHAWGITRVNVYVGEAAGYVIRDATEQTLVENGILPGTRMDGSLVMGGEIPLIIQDKTFVDAATIKDTDPTWAWGSQPWNGIKPANPTANWMTPVTGDLWWPHVYMPAQNPFDITGIAPMGRWAYGPYFWPATQNEYQPVLNPYYHPLCDPADPTTPGSLGGFCQPNEIPSTPNPSWGAEAFMDTPVVNGTAYPVMTVEPKAYRLRILNAAHDRFFNLSLFQAARNTTPTWAEESAAATICNATAADNSCTEVKMLPAVVHPGFPATWPADGRPGGVPDFTTRGPDWIMIGTEGGFLPRPVVIPAQPVNWNADVTTFNAGNVNTGSLILGPAERADVVVDFSAFAGQTLILYNDAPAPWPALDPHYDYYTDPFLDNTGMGGYGPILPGKGPNIRTVMQIRVAGTPDPAFNVTALETAFNPAVPADGVFRLGQDPIIAGQGNMNPTGDPTRYEAFPFDDTYELGAYMQDFAAYNSLYGATFPTTYPNWGVARINDTQISFFHPEANAIVTSPLQAKAIQDEQGETFDMFGRMRAALGLQLIQAAAGQVNFVVQTYSDPSTEILEENGIQVWKITHNGVDTHPVHFHLFDVQVLNRVGWDGFIRLPDPTELGWKDTVRISPLEDTIVALKPVTPRLPFGVPESVRPLNPATILGSMTELTPLDPYTGEIRDPTTWNGNEIVNLDWEYVWHCHILSHEENDMMRPISFKFVEALPASPSGLTAAFNGNFVDLAWIDPTPVDYLTQGNFGNPQNEIGFQVERSSDNGGNYAVVGTALANATTFTDSSVASHTDYIYRVSAYNVAGMSLPSNGALVTTLITPVAAATLSAVPASPQLIGTTVDFTAAGQGGSGTYEYKFLLRDTLGAWSTLQDYSTTATLAWNTTGLAAGTYRITAHVRNTGSTATYEAFAYNDYRIATPVAAATAVTLAAVPASPQLVGTTVNFTAAGQGGTGTYEYKFGLRNTVGLWTTLRDYSPTATLSWNTTGLMAGYYRMVVHVRSAGSIAAYEAFAYNDYRIADPVAPATGATLSAAPASPQLIGTTVDFTAAGQGGSGTYEYKFFLRDTIGTWTTLRDYSTTATLAWNTTGLAAGTYRLVVHVRSAGSLATYEAFASSDFSLVTSIAPATGATLAAAPASPQLIGTTVNFTAAGQGGTGTYEYMFWLKDTAGAWTVLQNYSPTATLAWNTTGLTAGTYQIVVHVRSSGSTAAYEAFASSTYAIAAPVAPATGATLSAAPASPQLVGTTVNFTAAGQGGTGTYEYKFWLKDTAGVWTVVQNYSPTATLAWNTTGLIAGIYQVVVHVRSAGSIATYEAFASSTYAIAAPVAAATGATLSAAPTSPQPVGTAVGLTAAGQGGTGTYEYKFWLRDTGGVWTVLRDYSTTATLAWNTTGLAAGTYRLVVHVRSAGSIAIYEAFANSDYLLQ